jgi:hypothetical protein
MSTSIFDHLADNAPLFDPDDPRHQEEQPQADGTIELDYQPREQFIDFHQRNERFAAMVVHRRAGKTVSAIHDIIIRALRTSKKDPRYAYVAPFYSQAKSIAWNYLKNAVRAFAIEIRESELSVTLPNGAIIRLFGADNPDTLRGLYFDGIVLDEFGDFRPKLYGEVILPTIADRQGWLLAIGTPKGKNNAFYQICQRAKYSEDWYFKELKASTSGILPDSELKLMREQMSEEQYDQEFEISFSAALIGTYYSSQIAQAERDGRIDDKYDYDPNFPVFTASDLGISDSTVFWFWQPRPDGICVFDLEHDNGKPISHYADTLKHKPYEYETVWLPHDARAKSLQTGKSTIELMLQAGFPCRIVPSLKVQHGIDAVRATFPKIYMHPRVEYGIEALRVYRRKYDETNKVFLDKPLHDWASDFADAFRYMCLVAKVVSPTAIAQEREPVIKPEAYTLGQLFEDNERDTSGTVAKMRM